MRFNKVIITAFLSATALLGPLAPAFAASPGGYVAMGDSYSSGVGAGDYVGPGCARSANSYPALWSREHPAAPYTSVACSGATTATLMRTQLAALTPATTLVSVTIGGNDIGFANIMKACYLGGDYGCRTAVDSANQKATTTLPARLDNVYSTIRARSPLTRIVVLNYPDFYSGTASCAGISVKSQAKIDEGNGVLSRVIQQAADRNGAVFVDVRGHFAQHEVCSADPWIWGLAKSQPSDSYHPTASGYLGGYLAAFNSAAG